MESIRPALGRTMMSGIVKHSIVGYHVDADVDADEGQWSLLVFGIRVSSLCHTADVAVAAARRLASMGAFKRQTKTIVPASINRTNEHTLRT